MITHIIPHTVAAAVILTTQLVFAADYRVLENHSYELAGQVKDLKWAAEDVLGRHPSGRSIFREIAHVRAEIRDLDDAIVAGRSLYEIERQLDQVHHELEHLADTLTRGCSIGNSHITNYGPSTPVLGCQPGEDPMTFLLTKVRAMDDLLHHIEEDINPLGHHSALPAPAPAFQQPNPVPYQVLPPRYNTVPSNQNNPQDLFSRNSRGPSIDLGGVRLSFNSRR